LNDDIRRPNLEPSRERRPSGVGLGLRWEFLEALLDELPPLALLEVSPENYIQRGGYHAEALAFLAARYPVLSHGLTMSIGGVDPLDKTYLRELRAFIEGVKSPWHSDHLCFGSVDGKVLHDLLPIAFTQAVATRVADRVRTIEDAIGVPFAIENISYYMHAGETQMPEAEFIATVCHKADCGLMLDINNAYVNSRNFGFDVDAWMRTVPLDRVVQMHMAGHDWFTEAGEPLPSTVADLAHVSSDALIVDTHGAPVSDPVLELFAKVITRTGPVPVVLERDQDIPPLAVLLAEVRKIEHVMTDALERVATREPQVAGLS
jgi:uncharacterized protein (UPF0276 family)